jgi:tRNA-guanine transglycosylase
MRKISEEGVKFASPVNGDRLFLTPEISMQIQTTLNSDIVMQFDECTPYDTKGHITTESRGALLDGTVARAGRCAARRSSPAGRTRTRCSASCRAACSRPARGVAAALVEMDFPGYAVGGVSVGEPKEEMLRIMAHTPHRLPASKPRYLMGVGTPEDLVEGVAQGVDMFDCVMPTRNARNGHLFTRFGDLKIRNAAPQRRAPAGRDLHLLHLQGHTASGRQASGGFSRAYLHHLERCGEMLAPMLASIHNLHFYLNLMREIREALGCRALCGVRRGIPRGPQAGRLAPRCDDRAGGLQPAGAQAIRKHWGSTLHSQCPQCPPTNSTGRRPAPAAPQGPAGPPPSARRRSANAAERAAAEGAHHRAFLSIRLKKEPHRLVSAIGITGGSIRSARRSSTFMMPALNSCRPPSRVMPPSGKIASRSPSRSTCAARRKAASYTTGSSFCGAIGIALARRNSQPSTGSRKMRWSITK